MQTTDDFTTKIIWGFMLENTLFTEFEEHNHAIIESAYRQRKRKQASHYIHIVDANLPKPSKAKVYFGVVQNHLRMPGTRYYVTRRVIKTIAKPMYIPSPVSTSSTSTTSSNHYPSLDPHVMALFSDDLQLSTPNSTMDNYFGPPLDTKLDPSLLDFNMDNISSWNQQDMISWSLTMDSFYPNTTLDDPNTRVNMTTHPYSF
ncbi:uncharacterized protein B0P05DRAFT_520733, partial [Gilbertella persicaria]|uniref:uncharacterized protein n=1 Tax=Gilbertella persicaria TaxID=101096 RepID=UPI00221EB752